MQLVDRIREKCEEKGLSIRQLEIKAGLSNATIRKWETQIPSYDKVIAVAKALNVSFNWLVTGNETGELEPDEQMLIEFYRITDERGKRNILRTAKSEALEVKSSASQIG